MSLHGRKPKPREQRIQEGNPGNRPLPEPVLVSGRPEVEELMEPPADLDPEGKDFWRSSVVRLAEVGILDRVDMPALELLATQYARIKQAQRVIRKHGHFVKGSVGQIREHPALKIEREATTQFLKLAEHFALTPIARTRLGLAELNRRSLAAEVEEQIGSPNLTRVA